MPDATSSQSTLLPADARMFFRVIMEKRWIILAIMAVCLLAGIVFVARSPRIYEATTTIEIDSEQQKRIKPEGSRSEEKASEELLKTIEQKFVSPALITALLGNPELKDDPTFPPKYHAPPPDAALRGVLEDRISARLRSGTQLIDITVEDRVPRDGAKARAIDGGRIYQRQLGEFPASFAICDYLSERRGRTPQSRAREIRARPSAISRAAPGRVAGGKAKHHR